MRGADTSSDPCPWVILNDVGGAFCMGAIGGGIWHSIKGARNSPQNERLRGAINAMKVRGPILGGNFAVWGGMFNTFDCAMKGIRKKEDPWNTITAGALTGAMLSVRGGMKSMAFSGVVGGVLLALIEGVGIAIGRMATQQPPPLAPPPPQ